ncbi:MAG: glycosyltransferase family 4 protein [Vicinamibacterales bacterium]
MKLAIVVQRYGADISGGAELHARYIAEHLSRQADVRVLTTCARDYVTWRNELPPGPDTVNGVPLERFPVVRERDPHEFGARSARVFRSRHSIADELRWVESGGPFSPALLRGLRRARRELDYILFFSARYYQSIQGARIAADRAVLVPTSERDPALGLSILGALFRGVRGIMYNSLEERALIQGVASNAEVPGVVVGVGSEVPPRADPARFRRKYGIASPFVIYVGRIDENKGCRELFDYFTRYAERSGQSLLLVLVGTPVLEIPPHPRIRHLGYVSDEDKFDAVAAAVALVMPSHYESLSMVVLEAWALGRPVLANARCDVLLGQCLRSNGGLYYEDSIEFSAALDRLLHDRPLAAALGAGGRAYYERHYAWPVVERKYMDMFARLDAENAGGAPRRMTPLPGWWARQRANLPPAADVVQAVPAGPVPAGCPNAGRGARRREDLP